MGKSVNQKGKQSHNSRQNKEMSRHWKHGKSSGDPERTEQKRERKQARKRGKK